MKHPNEKNIQTHCEHLKCGRMRSLKAECGPNCPLLFCKKGEKVWHDGLVLQNTTELDGCLRTIEQQAAKIEEQSKMIFALEQQIEKMNEHRKPGRPKGS